MMTLTHSQTSFLLIILSNLTGKVKALLKL
nr:MAG TPA: hypothetical protein [Caudoviricetes sp.]